eukprot:jgi/Astpho2/1498/fgenesh1_pm.00026_%23_13_t
MGNKSKQKDRGYVTATEWREEWGGAKDRSHLPFRRLPFHCCAISFTPFEDPACTADGTVYDITNIVPYVQKFKRHPVSGEPLQLKDVIKLNFYKNNDGEYHCPMLHKVFTESTHIVAIKPSGNVYCWEAIQELNIKPRFMQDLLTDEKFTRKDIIHIQDPMNLQARNLAKFDHVVKERQLQDPEELLKQQADPAYTLKSMSEDTARAMAKLGGADAQKAFEAGGGGLRAATQRMLAEAQAAGKAKGTIKEKQEGPDPRQAMQGILRHTTSRLQQAPSPAGAASRSFTSTAVNVVTKNTRQRVRVERNPSKKGYLRLHTNLGDLNLELHCDIAPRTCENFILLAESGYYTGTKFHRLIKNFMIQGGDPTGTGSGGESIYGPTFRDEVDSRLLHGERGVLSMANSGKDTNGSQFFILFKSAAHLNFKHTVFGKLVGGLNVLSAMEKVPVDGDDRPEKDIEITGCTLFVNPYKEMEEEERRKAEAARKKAEKDSAPAGPEDEPGSWFTNPSQSAAAQAGQPADGVAGGVGKYLKMPGRETTNGAPAAAAHGAEAAPAVTKHMPQQKGYGNFDAW